MPVRRLNMLRWMTSLLLLMGAAAASGATYDIVVYGGTCSGITAAVQARRMGKSVVLVCPETHLGGLTISGLGWTDTKDANCIGGLSREFYHRIWQYYNDPAAWVYQGRGSYNVSWQAGPGIQDGSETMWTFEPHVAEAVFEQWLVEAGAAVVRNRWLDRGAGGVTMQNGRIAAIRTLSYDPASGFTEAETYAGRMFIDASYEGDLMASAGVSYRIGRDARSEYNETLNGIYFKSTNLSPSNSPYKGVDPYVVKGDPSSGLIPQIEGEFTDMGSIGGEDDRLQAFNLRMCLTDVAANKVTISKPANYQERDYELLLRLYEAGQSPGFTTQRMPNLKTDSNNSGLMSLDWPGGNYSMEEGWVYSEATYEERMAFNERQRNYVHGLLWTMQNHPRVPSHVRSERSRWGLCRDEFEDNGYWPYFAYVREARRLEGEMVMTEHHVKMASGHTAADSIGQGSYSLDSHVVRRVVIDGTIWDEGGFYQWWSTGYPISYRAILPRREQATNLLVPVCLSASHAAFGSIRMEPTYMILGQSAATAAALAIDHEYDLQDLPYDLLRTRLLMDGQRLKETFTSVHPAVLLNFGAAVSDDTNSPAHALGKISGSHWNLVTGDRASGVVLSDGTAADIGIDVGKTQPNQTVVEWDRHGFINSALGNDYSTGVWAGNARSAMFVNDGTGSHAALGVRVSGLEAGIYALYTVAMNTSTAADDSFSIYAFAVDGASGDTDFADRPTVLMDNTRKSDAWAFGENCTAPIVRLPKGGDLVVVVEGRSDAGWRAFLNLLGVVRVANSPLAPLVTADPQPAAVYAADDPQSEGPAVLTCRFRSPSAPIVTWYRVNAGGSDQVMDQPQDADVEVTGPTYDEATREYVSSLVISNVDAAANGKYYCRIENADGIAVSLPAELLIKEMLAHWTLDAGDYAGGQYRDASGNGHGAAVSGAPSFTGGADGRSGGALALTSSQGSGTLGTWNPSAATGRISICAWVYWMGGSETSIIMDKANAWDAGRMMWTWGINPSTQRINFVSSGSSEFQTPISQTHFRMNEWHHLAVTHDGFTNAVQLFVDGEPVSAGTLVMGSKTDAGLRLGIDYSGRYFRGRLDDVRVYNYVLDERGLLDAYNGAAAVKKNICDQENFASQFDFSGPAGSPDCRVDFYDLAEFTLNWMSCGLYPATSCGE